MEIATGIGGALLSVSFEKLFDKLASPELRQFVSKKEVQSELHNWETMLPKIHAVLEDAEHKQTTTRPVKIWLSELRDLVYDVEDVLDEFATEALRIKHQATAAASSSKNQVLKILPSLFTVGTGLKLNAKMGFKLKKITSRFETICTQKISLDLKDKAVGDRRGRSGNTTRIPTTSLSDPHIFGRDKDKEALLDLLMADGDGADCGCVSVIPIQGMGGLGKTTLAQQLYNDERVKVHFQLRVWVCVSDTSDILDITKTILQDVGGGAHDVKDLKDKNLNQVQVDLEKELSEKKFFIVLDDVWNEKYEDWTTLCKPFNKGATGSKIIVTTRNQEVADLVRARTTQAYSLGKLPDDDCVSLFAQHALGATNFDGHPVLEDTGRKIVEKETSVWRTQYFGDLLSRSFFQPFKEDNAEFVMHDLAQDVAGELCFHLNAIVERPKHLPTLKTRHSSFSQLFYEDLEFFMKQNVCEHYSRYLLIHFFIPIYQLMF